MVKNAYSENVCVGLFFSIVFHSYLYNANNKIIFTIRQFTKALIKLYFNCKKVQIKYYYNSLCMRLLLFQ